MTVKVNAANELLVEGELASVAALKERAKEFISNPKGSPELPTRPKNAVISLQNDRGTNYETYLHVYNELKAAYNELWNQRSHRLHGKAFADLGKAARREILQEIPLVISEADPTDYSGD